MIEWLKVVLLNAFIDKQRRKHVLSRVMETYIPSVLVLGVATWSWWAFVYAAVIVVSEYVLYEFVLEPFGTIDNWFTTGHYFERSPRDGVTEGQVPETYKIG